jgi:CrcB protein
MNVGMYLAVAAGGAVGAMLRYAVAQATAAGLFGIAGPMATLVVNIAGSAIMGLVAGLAASGFVLPEAWRGFLAVGLLGALTTFSSFALDAGTLFQKQGLAMACVYVGLSVCLSLASFALCFWLVRMPS